MLQSEYPFVMSVYLTWLSSPFLRLDRIVFIARVKKICRKRMRTGIMEEVRSRMAWVREGGNESESESKKKKKSRLHCCTTQCFCSPWVVLMNNI